MSINTPSGNYVREASESDYSLIRECVSDWPGPKGRWSAEMCRKLLDSSQDNFQEATLRHNPIPSVPNFTLILCTSLDVPVGFMNLAYHGSDTLAETGVDIISVAITPGERGGGYYSVFEEAMGWFINQYLQAGAGHYEVLEDAPQVMSKSDQRQPAKLWTKRDEAGKDKTMVQLTRSSYEASAFSTEAKKAGYSIVLTDSLGVEITVTARVLL